MARTAVIVGAGIGGLSVGIALRNAGWDIRIFERAASARELGFGLLLAPNAMAALRELGVADVVLERGWTPTRGELRRMDGTVLKRAEFPPPECSAAPLSWRYGRRCMARCSRQWVKRRSRSDVRPPASSSGRTAVSLSSSRTARRSTATYWLAPTASARRSDGRCTQSSHVVAVRGGVHGQVRHLGDLSAVYYMDRGVEAFTVRASDTGIYWALSLAEELLPPGMRDPAAVLSHMLPHFEAPYRAIASATTDMRCDELVDGDPLPFWSQGRVTLLGDAAHPVLPHTGQGAAQAIVDAVTLGRLLAGDADVGAALRSYECERRKKTTALLGQGRRTARVMRMTNPAACYAREIAVRLIPVKPMVKLFARINGRAGVRR